MEQGSGLDNLQRLGFSLSFMCMSFSLLRQVEVLSLQWQKRATLHTLQLGRAWILMADMALVLTYLPAYVVMLTLNTFPSGPWCQALAFVTVTAIIFNLLAFVLLSQLTYKLIVKPPLHYMQAKALFRLNFFLYFFALLAVSVLVTLAFFLSGQLGAYRGIYCMFKDPSNPSDFWPFIIIFVLSVGLQCFLYQLSSKVFKRSLHNRGLTPSIAAHQRGKPSLPTRMGLTMALFFYSAWTPMIITWIIAYFQHRINGKITYPLGLDTFAWLCVSFVPYVNMLNTKLTLNSALHRKDKDKPGGDSPALLASLWNKPMRFPNWKVNTEKSFDKEPMRFPNWKPSASSPLWEGEHLEGDKRRTMEGSGREELKQEGKQDGKTQQTTRSRRERNSETSQEEQPKVPCLEVAEQSRQADIGMNSSSLIPPHLTSPSIRSKPLHPPPPPPSSDQLHDKIDELQLQDMLNYDCQSEAKESTRARVYSAATLGTGKNNNISTGEEQISSTEQQALAEKEESSVHSEGEQSTWIGQAEVEENCDNEVRLSHCENKEQNKVHFTFSRENAPGNSGCLTESRDCYRKALTSASLNSLPSLPPYEESYSTTPHASPPLGLSPVQPVRAVVLYSPQSDSRRLSNHQSKNASPQSSPPIVQLDRWSFDRAWTARPLSPTSPSSLKATSPRKGGKSSSLAAPFTFGAGTGPYLPSSRAKSTSASQSPKVGYNTIQPEPGATDLLVAVTTPKKHDPTGEIDLPETKRDDLNNNNSGIDRYDQYNNNNNNNDHTNKDNKESRDGCKKDDRDDDVMINISRNNSNDKEKNDVDDKQRGEEKEKSSQQYDNFMSAVIQRDEHLLTKTETTTDQNSDSTRNTNNSHDNSTNNNLNNNNRNESLSINNFYNSSNKVLKSTSNSLMLSTSKKSNKMNSANNTPRRVDRRIYKSKSSSELSFEAPLEPRVAAAVHLEAEPGLAAAVHVAAEQPKRVGGLGETRRDPSSVPSLARPNSGPSLGETRRRDPSRVPSLGETRRREPVGSDFHGSRHSINSINFVAPSARASVLDVRVLSATPFVSASVSDVRAPSVTSSWSDARIPRNLNYAPSDSGNEERRSITIMSPLEISAASPPQQSFNGSYQHKPGPGSVGSNRSRSASVDSEQRGKYSIGPVSVRSNSSRGISVGGEQRGDYSGRDSKQSDRPRQLRSPLVVPDSVYSPSPEVITALSKFKPLGDIIYHLSPSNRNSKKKSFSFTRSK
eukprot:gb/GEZN01000639.1/.p1 GENE.gb/GEZN01000639.1/~~gb/GEZN01000639.1/.p1  ORF type:complete len:1237 (+),score=203.61 gb/GEZN01000639.1/:86-3796(+)